VSGFPVEGREEVAAGFDELRRSLDDLSAVHREVLGPLIPEVQSRTPVLTGELRSSFRLVVDRESGSVESGLRYAGPIEFGSVRRGIEPVAMVRSTIQDNAGAINAGYSSAITDRAARIGFKVDG
jgi:hypothetical protein